MSGGENARRLGSWGESLTADDLRRKGWEILDRNFRCRYGEIDIVAADQEYLIFVEVKLRKDSRFGSAAAFVTAEKRRKLRLAAECYLLEHPTRLQPRFDVAEVYAPDGLDTEDPAVSYIIDAF